MYVSTAKDSELIISSDHDQSSSYVPGSTMESSSTSAHSSFLNETYTEYVSITNGDDDFNDEDLQLSRAIAASMEEGSVEAETRTTKEIITALQQ